MRLSLISLLVLGVLSGAARADNAFVPGPIELYPTPSAVGIEVAYTNDDNGNAAAALQWKPDGGAAWRDGVDMVFDRKRRLIWASVWPLDPGQTIEIKIVFNDPDGADKTVFQKKATTRFVIPEGVKGRILHVAPAGDDSAAGTSDKPWRTLGHAVKAVKPGDTVVLAPGVYDEGDLCQRLKGTEDKPIIFRAEKPGTALLDSSRALEAGKTDWKAIGDGVFATALDWPEEQGRYLSQDGLRMFFYLNLADLKSDAQKTERAWTYDLKAKALYVRTGSGKKPSEHTYRPSRHQYGFHLTASQHVIVKDLALRNYGASAIRLSEGAKGCVIIGCTITNVPGGIFMKSETTRDNAIWHNHIYEQGMLDFSWHANYAVPYATQAIYCDRAGRGNSFCHNKIHDFFDLISVESWKNPDKLGFNRDCDVLFNELWNTTDDAIEVDGGGVNMRVSHNAIRNAHSAISLAPVERGPVWVTRNTVSFRALFLKFNVGGVTSHGPAFIYHNTGYCLITGADGGTSISFAPTLPCTNKTIKNNIFVSNEWSVRQWRKDNTLDANCYWHVPGKPPRRFQTDKKIFGTIAEFAKATGQEMNGMYADPLLTDIGDAGHIKADLDLSKVGPAGIFLVKDAHVRDLRLGKASPCLDRGVRIRSINDDFKGKAPDMGAIETP